LVGDKEKHEICKKYAKTQKKEKRRERERVEITYETIAI
jgi:hypothetical protein